MARLLSRTLVPITAALTAAPAFAGDGIDHITPTVQLQGWATVLDQDEDPQADVVGYGDPEHDPGFSIPRARFGLELQEGIVSFRGSVGVSAPYDGLVPADSSLGLVDASVTLAQSFGASRLAAHGGLMRVPFSREMLMSSRDLVFQERAVGAEWIVPPRDVGLEVDYQLSSFRARIGVFNGNSDLFGDDNVGLLTALRVELDHGPDTYRTWNPDGGVSIGVGGSAYYDADVATSELGAGLDAIVRIGRFAILAEGMIQRLDPSDTTVAPPAVVAATTRLGATGQLSWYQPLAWGGVELAARAAWFDDAAGTSDNGDVLIVHAGATWRELVRGVDLGAGVIHREELGGRKVANDTLRAWAQFRFPSIGRDAVVTSIPPAFDGRWRVKAGQLAGMELDLRGGARPRGSVVIPDTAPAPIAHHELSLELASYDRAMDQVRFRIRPFQDQGEAIWFELSPAPDGLLCGYGYEQGERDAAASGGDRGAWLCWEPAGS